MIELVNKTFGQKEAYTPDKIKQEFGAEEPFDLVKDIPHIHEVKQQNRDFDLYKRAYHVFTEAQRVHLFKNTCQDPSIPEEEKIAKLGKLMNESQLSCHMYYDCSSKNLEEITQMARDNGALGSRLTGAGWGGCSVSLVKKDILETFIDKMYDYYTKEREPGE